MQKKELEKLQENLLLWYEKNGRKTLPWRNLQSQNCDESLKHIVIELMEFISAKLCFSKLKLNQF